MPRLKITTFEWLFLEGFAGFVLMRWAVLGLSAWLGDGHPNGWLLNVTGVAAAAFGAGSRWRYMRKRDVEGHPAEVHSA